MKQALAKRLAIHASLALLLGIALSGMTLDRLEQPARATAAAPCPSGWVFTERPAGNTEIPYPVYCERTFTYSATTQVAAFPEWVQEVHVDLFGAPGGVGGWDSGVVGGQSGAVGRVTGTTTVSPGSQLQISVGGRGANGSGTGPDPVAGPAGGFSSLGFSGGSGGPRGCSFAGCGSDRGGAGTGAGGGAATVISFSARILVAAGAGGGGGANCFGCASPNGDIVGNGRNGQTASSYRAEGLVAGGPGAGNNGSAFRFNASAGGGGGGVRGGTGGAASLDGGNAGLNSTGAGLSSSYVATSAIPRPAGDTSTGGIAVLRFIAIPVVSSISTAPGGISNASSFSFTVTFSEAVTGLGPEDLQLGGTSGSLPGWTLSILPAGDGRTYLVNASHPNPQSGTLNLSVDATGVAAGDRVGSGVLTSTAVTLDRTPPSVVSSAFLPTANPGQFEVVITFSEPISSSATIDWGVFTFTGSSQGWSTLSPVVSGSTLRFVVSSSSLVDDTTLQYSIGLGFVEDAYGNQLVAAYQDSVLINLDAVSATFSNEPSAFSISTTVDLNFAAFVYGLTTSDFSIVGAAVGCDITGLSGSGSSYRVTVGTCNPSVSGTIQVALTGSAALSLLGAPSPEEQLLSEPILYDNVAPVASVVSKTISDTRASYVISFSESVTGFSTNSISVSHTATGGASGWSVTNLVALGNNRFSFDVENIQALNGNLSFSLRPGITDLAGNPALSGTIAASSSVQIMALPFFDPGPSSTIGPSGSKISPSFDLNSRGSFIYGVRVELTNPAAGDTLQFTTQNSITRGANSTNTVLFLEATTGLADTVWETALQSIVFSTSSTVTTSRSIEYHVKPQRGYDYVSGHFFQYKPATAITIANASTSAAALSLFGLQGYLATPTDAFQNAALVSSGVGTAWLGLGAVGSANDRARVLVGPGAGQTIVYAPTFGNEGDSSFLAGDTTVYINIYANGTWNDLGAGDHGAIQGYAVEFGGSPGDPELLVRKTHTHIVDITGPHVTRVYATDGDYQRGDEVELNVVFNEPVIVSGGPSPESRLEIMPGVFAEYVSGSGTTVLKYRYLVGAGVTTSDLGYVATNSLTAGSRVFRDLVGNAADLTLPAPGTSGSLESQSNVVLSGDVLTIRLHTPITQSAHSNVSYVVSSAVALNCSSLGASDFTFQNLNSSSFQVTPVGNSTSCTITLPHTIGKASFGNAILGRSPSFEISTHDSVTYSNLLISSNRVLVTNPADPGKGEVTLDTTNLNRQRPSVVGRADASGLFPGASPQAAATLRSRSIIAPPNGTVLPELGIRGDFRQLTNMNDPVSARKQQVIRAGDAVVAKLQVPPNEAANFKVISYFDFNSGWLYAGSQDFDSNGEVESDPLVFTQPGEYFVRMYVVPKTASPGIQYPILPLSLQSQGLQQLGLGTFGLGRSFVTITPLVLTQTQLDQIVSKQSLELILIIEAGDIVAVQSSPSSEQQSAPPPGQVTQSPSSTTSPEVVPEGESTESGAPESTPAPQEPESALESSPPDNSSNAGLPGQEKDNSVESPDQESSLEVPAADAESDPTPESSEIANESGNENRAEGLDAYEPFGNPEQTNNTLGLLAAIAALAAVAAAGANSRLGEAKPNEDSLNAKTAADFDFDTVAHDQQRWGDRLSMWAMPLLTLLDRPTTLATRRAARFSPMVSKLINDGVYLQAIFGTFAGLLALASIALALIGLGQNQEILLHPPIEIFLAIMVIGLFSSMAGAIGVVTFIVGSLPLVDPSSLSDWRMLSGIVIAGFGPILLARSIRNFRRKPSTDVQGLLDRIGDIGFASLIGGWVAGLVLRALPALTGLAVPAADYVLEAQIIATFAIAIRILIEDFAARFYPNRMGELTPENLPQVFVFQAQISLALRYLFFVFIASAFMGFGFVVWVAAALFLVPSLLGLIRDRLPRSTFLTKWMPTGLPALAMIMVLEMLLRQGAITVIGEHPEFPIMFIFIVLGLASIVSLLSNLARPLPGERHWLAEPSKQVLYRLGGFVTFLLLIWLISGL